MRDVSVTDAKAKLLQYLDEVELGEVLRITRRGKVIARLVPERQLRTEEIAAAVAGIRAIGRRSQGLSARQILQARESLEGERRR
jgi:prevent-host-death family protein